MTRSRAVAPLMPPIERPFIGTSLRTAQRVAAVVAVLASAFAVVTLALQASLSGLPHSGLGLGDVVAWVTGALTYAGVGLVVAWRRPANSIGWLFLLIGLSGTSGVLGVTYATFAASAGAPFGPVAAWWSNCEFALGSGLILDVFVLLFPTGRPPSWRWGPLLGAGLGGTALTTVALALAPGTMLAVPLDNPFGRPDAASLTWALLQLGAALLIVGAIGALASVFVRLARADPVERQQLKWMGAAAVVLLAGAVLNLAQGSGQGGFGQAGGSLALDSIPVAAGIAILRYRLYDIDVIINRALVYGATSVGIAVAFFAGIVVLQALLRPFTSGSEIAVAVSTLAGVALVQPFRRRVQRAVDRRFYRERYDAARTLDAFSVRLRDEVDLDAVRAELIEAVDRTVRPVHASVWLRAGRAP